MFGTLEPDVYFYGAQIEKIASDKYRIKKGGFTTCVQPTARWEIVSGTATLQARSLRGSSATPSSRSRTFRSSICRCSTTRFRRTIAPPGFLLPMYGSSLATGSSISNAFFWAINRSQDATFFHDWMFSRGNGLGAEYRYLLAPQAQGDLRYYWLDEKEAVINGLVRNPRQSKSLRGGLTQNLPLGLSARARVDYITDVTVRQTYDHDFYNASNSTRQFSGGVSGAWRNLSTNASYNQTETFYLQDSTVTGQTPGLTAALSGVRLGPLPLFASVNAEAGRNVFIRRSGDHGAGSQPDEGRHRALDQGRAQHAAVPPGERDGLVSHDLLQRKPGGGPQDPD